MKNSNLERRLQIIESDYGRKHGWYLEYHGARLAVLMDPMWAEMFWVTYRIEPLTDDPRILDMLSSRLFWYSDELTFRNRVFDDEVIDHAFGNPERSGNEVTMRSLYFFIKELTLWECLTNLRRWPARKRLGELCILFMDKLAGSDMYRE